MFKILAINPGSTSTKLAYYEDRSEKAAYSVEHTREKLLQFPRIEDQMDYRIDLTERWLMEKNIPAAGLDAIVGRGGMLYPIRCGAYEVDELMIKRLHDPITQHESNLAGLIAFRMAEGGKAVPMIYDGITADEMADEARITGLPQKERPSLGHTLSMRAVSHLTAEALGGKYADYNFVVIHLGGGITASVHEKGRMKDVISDDEGCFSPERTGGLPSRWLMEAIFENGFDLAQGNRMIRGRMSGINAFLGTSDMRAVERMAKEGDRKARIILDALIYQIAKDIGALATTLKGKADRIILTGGIAHSKYIVGRIAECVGFIAPLAVIPGETEMQALALGAYRVLNGEEPLQKYTDEPRQKLFPEYGWKIPLQPPAPGYSGADR